MSDLLIAAQHHPLSDGEYIKANTPAVTGGEVTYSVVAASGTASAFAPTPAEILQAHKTHYAEAARKFTEIMQVEIPKKLTGGHEVTKELYAFWQKQVDRAQRQVTQNATPADIANLTGQIERRGRGETIDQLSQKILAKAAVFDQLGSAMDGTLTAVTDAIAAATTPAAVETEFTTRKAAAEAEIDGFLNSLLNA